MGQKKSGKPLRRKKTVGSRKKWNLLVQIAIAGFLLSTILAAFIVLGVKPQLRTDEKKAENSSSIPYEEPGLTHSEATVDNIEKSLSTEDVTPPTDGKKPVLAIVIDDMGYQQDNGMKLIDLDLELSFAFLPSSPYLGNLSRQAARNGRDILLHFPMEAASEMWDPGPGAVYITMNEKQIRAQFEKNIAALPIASGVNNHMGSRFTQNRNSMKIFLKMVKKYDLYFLDSMTSRNSVGEFLAREMGIPTSRRHVFLDNEQDVQKIIKQIRHLLIITEKNGRAIGIGHPYKETFVALKSMRSEIKNRVRLVGVSRLVH